MFSQNNILTSPHHPFDDWLWPIIKIIWEPFSLKRSHWWHWRPYQGPAQFRQRLAGNLAAKARRGFWSTLIQTNFAWTQVAIIEPKEYTGAYQVGFCGPEISSPQASERWYQGQLCAMIIEGPSALLVGSGDLYYFAKAYPNGQPIELKNLAITTKTKLTKNVILL